MISRILNFFKSRTLTKRDIRILGGIFLLVLAGAAYFWYSSDGKLPPELENLLNTASSDAGSSLVVPGSPASSAHPVGAAAAPGAPHPTLPPKKPWLPPAVLPAQPNWTWTTSDGRTYQNVVVVKIEPYFVSILDLAGADRIAIHLLPPEVQKRLNYDPRAAANAVHPPMSLAANPPPPPPETFAVPIKLWAPPDHMPAYPDWTWTTADGTTYQAVVVTDIEPETVTINHSLGVAHVSISMLPPDIQKQLSYDPVTAAVWRAENQRESEHPFYSFAARADAQAVAHQMRWPLAWVAGNLVGTTADPRLNPEADLTQMAISELKSQAIIIFIDGNNDLPALPATVRDELFNLDDGPLPGGHHYRGPKVVISNPGATKIFGRASFTQMMARREVPLDEILASIPRTPEAKSPANGSVASTPASVPSAVQPVPVFTPVASTSGTGTASSGIIPWAPPDVMPAHPNWTWETSDGTTYQNVVVTEIEPTTVTVAHSLGVAHIPISLLPPDIQKQLNYNPHADSQISNFLDGKLVSADGSAASLFVRPIQYYAIYYSAQWSPPCHVFTPRLVKWYNKFKPTHPNFELIFVSDDHDETSMLAHMKEMAMPWPAVRFTELKHDGSGIEKFAGSGIPDLVLVDASGKVLSDSFQNGTYVGPEAVVGDIDGLVGGTTPVPLVRRVPAAPLPCSETAFISTQDSSPAANPPAGT